MTEQTVATALPKKQDAEHQVVPLKTPTKPKQKPSLKVRMKRFAKKPWVRFILLPFALAAIYYGLIASDRYVSETQILVKQASGSQTGDMPLALMGAQFAPGMQDAQLVRTYVQSLDMLRYLDETLAIREHYSSHDADLLSRLWESQSQEQFLKYYRKHLEIRYDELSGVLTLRIQAWDPDYAQQLMQAILNRSEKYINQIGHRLASEQVGFAQGELERAQDLLLTGKQDILSFQDEHKLFSPEQEGVARLQMVNELEADLTRQKAELKSLRSYLSDSSAEVVAQANLIRALEAQLSDERRKLVGSNQSVNLNEVNSAYANLQMNLEFATDMYRTSLVSLEQARIEAYRKLKHLVVVDSPSLAESAEYPRRIYNLVTILAVLSLLFGAGRIIAATIREHKDL